MCFAINMRILVMLRIEEVGKHSALISGDDQTLDSEVRTRQSQ